MKPTKNRLKIFYKPKTFLTFLEIQIECLNKNDIQKYRVTLSLSMRFLQYKSYKYNILSKYSYTAYTEDSVSNYSKEISFTPRGYLVFSGGPNSLMEMVIIILLEY